jgi:AraC-like DNA-binding protein
MTDALSDILSLLEARSYVSTGLKTGGEWSVVTHAFEGLKFNAVIWGHAWLKTESMAVPLRLSAGDCFILTSGTAFVMASDLTLAPVPAEQVFAAAKDGIAQWNGSDEFFVLGGKMTLDEPVARLLLDVLPDHIHLDAETPDAEALRWLIQRLVSEVSQPRPGGSSAGPHLMHLIFIESLRAFLHGSDVLASGWAAGLRDPRLAKSVAAMHAESRRDWTLIELADIAGMSRANFALRFKQCIGISPMNYLSRWRMYLASRDLRQGTDSVSSIALALGFGSESAFSAAFKRHFGHAPTAHRRNVTLVPS